MRNELSQAIEDYLKTIYSLAEHSERVSTSDIAIRMRVSPASVTGMIQKMAAIEPPLVEYQKHRGVLLTPQGERAALEVIRHHRLLELFLHDTLGFAWHEVHSEADRLEHVISEEFEERIAQALGNPSHDPHGEPIPTRDLRLPQQAGLPLSSLRAGQSARIRRVDAADHDLLRYLGQLGLVPGTELHVSDYSAFDGNLYLRIARKMDLIVLGPRITDAIFVEEIEAP
jgi:DtxR family transcriptional regulator, Mn-dependent transcriptional regulator